MARPPYWQLVRYIPAQMVSSGILRLPQARVNRQKTKPGGTAIANV
jgi:hypothetical protein